MSNDYQDWYLIRHAPPINPLRLAYGQMDIDADYSDITLFQRLAGILPDQAAWISSPLRRAFLTATGLRAHKPAALQTPILCERDLIEQSFGLWQNRCKDDLPADAN